MRYFLLAQKGTRIEFFDASFNRSLRVEHNFRAPHGPHAGTWWVVIKVFNHYETRRIESLCAVCGLAAIEEIFRDEAREPVAA